MRTGLSQQAGLRQEQRINPRLYQAMDMLYMPMMDLQQHLKQELLTNPFLELLEPEEEERETESAETEKEKEKEKEKAKEEEKRKELERQQGAVTEEKPEVGPAAPESETTGEAAAEEAGEGQDVELPPLRPIGTPR